MRQVWDARSHQLLQHYPAHDAEVTSISFHESGNFLLSSSADASLKVRARAGMLEFRSAAWPASTDGFVDTMAQ